MNDKKFERELKLLIHYVREYGVQQSSITKKDLPGSKRHNTFVANVHKGYMLAQQNVLCNLSKILKERKLIKAKLKVANRDKDKENKQKCLSKLENSRVQEYAFRKGMDSIAWTLLGFEISDVRRLYGGEELIDITDSNIESCIKYSENVFSNNPLEFALISDLTSFVQTGDMLHYEYGKKLSIVELKSGKTSKKVFEVLDSYQKSKCDYFMKQILENEDDKFREQVVRTVKQMATATTVLDTLKTGQGIDRFTGLNVHTVQEQLELATFTDIVLELIEKARRKGYAISVIENCLPIGVYFNNRFPNTAFSAWMNAIKHETPIYDLRQSILDPVTFPLFLQPFSQNTIVDILMGRISILMSIDINTWLSPLEKDGYVVRWFSEKETRKFNANIKGKASPLCINGKAVAVEKDDFSFIIQGGMLARMFTSFNTPSALRTYLTEIHEKAFIKKKDNRAEV